MSIQKYIFYLLLIPLLFLFPIIKLEETESNTITLKFNFKGWITIYQDRHINIFNTSDLEIYLISENSLTPLNKSDFEIQTLSSVTYIRYYTKNEETNMLLKINKIINTLEALFVSSSAYSIEFSENFDFSQVTRMNKTFCTCQSLTTLKIGKFDASNIITMEDAFSGSQILNFVDFQPINTKNLINMRQMFGFCISLTSINLSTFNTEKVTDMGYMFWNCEKLTSLNLTNFNLTNVEDLRNMFVNCYKLETLYINFNNAVNVKYLYGMFECCESLISLDFNLVNDFLSDISQLFKNCSSLKYLKFGEFLGSNIRNVQNLFYGCDSLEYLNMSSFNPTNTKYFDDVFTDFETLNEIDFFSLTDNEYILRNFGNYLSIEYCKFNEYNSDLENDVYSKCKTFIGFKNCNCTNKNEYYCQKIINGIKMNFHYILNSDQCFWFEDVDNYEYLTDEQVQGSLKCNIMGIIDISKCKKCNNLLKYYQKFEEINMEEFYCYKQEELPEYNLIVYNDQLYFSNDSNLTQIENCNNDKCNKCDKYSNMRKICLECNKNKGYISFNKNGKYTDCKLEKTSDIEEEDDLGELTLSLIYKLLYEYRDKYYDKQNYIIQHKNNNYTISIYNVGINNMNNSYIDNYNNLNISKINMSACYQELIEYYNIKNDLIYLQVDYTNNQEDINYLLYSPQLNKTLNLDICKNKNITINKKLNLTQTDIDLITTAKEQGYNLLDINDEFYTNLCAKYTTTNGTDIILSDRLNDLYNFDVLLNYDNCDFDSFNITDYTINCETQIQTQFLNNSSDETNNKNSNKNSNSNSEIANSNLLTLKCADVFLSLQGISSNIGSYWYLICLSMVLGLMIYYLCKGSSQTKINLEEIIYNKTFHQKHKIKKNRKSCIPKSKDKKKNSSTSKIKLSKQNSSTIREPNSFFNLIVNKNTKSDNDQNEVIDIKKLTDVEINDLEYFKAVIYDKRDFCGYYRSLLRAKQFFIFMLVKDYNIPQIKIILFLYSLCLCLTVNECFFVSNTLHKIYLDNGNFNFLYQLPKIICATIIFSLVIFGLKKLTLNENEIIKFKIFVKKEAKSKEEAEIEGKKILKRTKIKFIILCILYLILMGFWYYAGAFCAVYSNTQSHLLINSIISFNLSMLYPFVFCLIPGFFRIPALRNKNMNQEKMYRISQILQNI